MARRAKQQKKIRQLELRLRGRGGAREGAGRPPRGERAGVSHGQRAALASRYPVHVTLRLRRGLPMLRQAVTLPVLREVRTALLYVLHNARRHGYVLAQPIDRYCSGAWFTGWKERIGGSGTDTSSPPVTAAKTWLLRQGFLRGGGRISVDAVPRAASA